MSSSWSAVSGPSCRKTAFLREERVAFELRCDKCRLPSMGFSHLGRALDVEWFLRLDETRSGHDLQKEDRKILAEVADGADAFEGWLAARRRAHGGRTLGVRISEAMSLVFGALLLLAIVAGSSVAEALLLYSAPASPTNLLAFLFATLVWPLLLLIGSVLVLLLRRSFRGSALFGEFLGWVVSWVVRFGQRLEDGKADWVAQWRELRRSARRYRDVEVLSWICASQYVALFFHLGAALSLLRLALFSDLTFFWSTTNQALSFQGLAAAFRVLTAPWCATTGVACVSLELVRETEFVRFTGQYASPEGAAVSGQWWGVLFLSLLVYGVLPRLVFALSVGRMLRHHSSKFSGRILELRRRLYRGVSVDAIRSSRQSDGASPSPEMARGTADTAETGTPCWLVFWRGATLPIEQEQGFLRELGLEKTDQSAAGGSDYAVDDALIQRLAEEPGVPVVLVVEGWEAPDKATRRFLQSVRESGGATRPVFVGVRCSDGQSGHEMHLWRDRLGLLQDPYLAVERLVEAGNRIDGPTNGARP